MKKLLVLLPYLVVMLVSFYILPLLLVDTGSAMLIMLVAIPLITLICSLVYGVHQGFNLLFPIITMVLFAPTVIIFYNLTAWVYIIVYGGIVLVGNAIGNVFYKKRQNSK